MIQRSPVLRLVETVKALLGMRVALSVDFLALYRAKVVAQSADLSTVDLQPDDRRIPGATGIPIALGLPGATAQVAQGAYMLLGWRAGDPSQPYAVPSWEHGASVTKLVLSGTTLHLGAESGSQFVALANLVLSELQTIATKFNNHNHVETGTTTDFIGPAQQYVAGSVAASNVRAL